MNLQDVENVAPARPPRWRAKPCRHHVDRRSTDTIDKYLGRAIKTFLAKATKVFFKATPEFDQSVPVEAKPARRNSFSTSGQRSTPPSAQSAIQQRACKQPHSCATRQRVPLQSRRGTSTLIGSRHISLVPCHANSILTSLCVSCHVMSCPVWLCHAQSCENPMSQYFVMNSHDQVIT